MSGWQRWAVTGVDRSANRYGIHSSPPVESTFHLRNSTQ
jgi:hypothetical protein